MLVLKEFRLANNKKTIINSALLTMAGSGYTSLGRCRSTTARASSGGHNSNAMVAAAAVGTRAAVAARARASRAGAATLHSHIVALLALISRPTPWVLGFVTTRGHPKAPPLA
jgi:hypothetical protein